MPHRRRSRPVVTSASTSAGVAPGKGTKTSTIGTMICGSSSRGVVSTETRPSTTAATTPSGVSGELMAFAASRPAMPGRGSVTGDLDPLAVSHVPRQVDDSLARGEAGQHRELISLGLTEPKPAQGGPAVGEDEHPAQVAPLDHRGARHGAPWAPCALHADAPKIAAAERRSAAARASPEGAAMGERV